jgi:hypothetical protein
VSENQGEPNYDSGDDFVVEFLGYRFGFNAVDFEQRVNSAAVRLGLISSAELEEGALADLVELTSEGIIQKPRSALGRYVIGSWDRVSLLDGESLVYWLRKLVFRGAWLDHRVKLGLLDVAWEESIGEFSYCDPKGGTTLLELAPVPSWRGVQYKPAQ